MAFRDTAWPNNRLPDAGDSTVAKYGKPARRAAAAAESAAARLR
jgi:hypothetical protein